METTYKVNYKGLSKRESYEDVINYLLNDPDKVQYPNRLAKFIRNSPQLTNLLDTDGSGYDD